MKFSRVQRSVASFASAFVLLLQISPAAAGGQFETARNNSRFRRPVEISFTKWVTTAPHMAGFVGGDVAARDFAGEVLEAHASTSTSFPAILRLEAIYDIQAGKRSFTALIHGGENLDTGLGILDGVILSGWRTGARVHVQFQALACTEAPDGTCFRGMIQIE
jgi:hypothetical protein